MLETWSDKIYEGVRNFNKLNIVFKSAPNIQIP